MTKKDRRSLKVDGAEIEFTPREPGVWEPLGQESAGPADLALRLLALSEPSWRGVEDATGRPAPPAPDQLAALPVAVLPRLLPALRAPWLSPAQEAALNGLEHHLAVRADYPGLDCAACAQQERAGEGPPDCAACPLPPVPGACLEALRLAALLRSAGPQAGALLPSLLAGQGPGAARLLLVALGLIQRHGGPSRPAFSGPGHGGMLE